MASEWLKLTLTQNMREMGSVARQRRTETRASRSAMQPGPSASPGHRNTDNDAKKFFFFLMCFILALDVK